MEMIDYAVLIRLASTLYTKCAFALPCRALPCTLHYIVHPVSTSPIPFTLLLSPHFHPIPLTLLASVL
jgi:hypothetical protein